MTPARSSRLRPPVVAQHAAPVLCLIASTMLLLGCAARRITKDYVFNVTGVVQTQDDLRVQGAVVTLELSGPVYEVVDLVRTRHVLTNDTGGFVFAYISHEPGVKYKITVSKEGFEPQSVSGAAPPSGKHIITLRKPNEPTKSDVTGDPVLPHYSPLKTHYSLSCHV